MIRSNHLAGPPKRRIAVIAMPRPQKARLGSIGPGEPAGYGPPLGWTTISDMQPESSANFMSTVISRQQNAVLNTPGTLRYTPAATQPAPNVPPWNSWLQPNCPPDSPGGSGSGSGSSVIATAATSPLFWAGLGAAALFLFSGSRKGK